MRLISVLLKESSLYVMAISLVVGSACVPVLPIKEKTPSPASQSVIAPENKPPVLHSLTADKKVMVSSTSHVVSKAEDPDSGKLTYIWTTNGGAIQGMGDVVKWNAPEMPGEYTVTVTVKDDRGGEAANSVSIVVTDIPNQPPVIARFMVQIQQPKNEVVVNPEVPLIERVTPVVRASRAVDIECIADDADGDELSYTWEVPAGRIIGEGLKIIWMAPTQPKRYIITVTITDSAGNSDTAMLSFDVSCCD
ncbi:PKD domain-containing protein [Chloroflexota bacterium]